MVTEDDCINMACSTIEHIQRLWYDFGGTTAIIVQFYRGMQQTRLHSEQDGDPEGYVALES